MFSRSFITLSRPLVTLLKPQQQRSIVNFFPIIASTDISTSVTNTCHLNHHNHHQMQDTKFSSSSLSTSNTITDYVAVTEIDNETSSRPYKILGVQQIAIGCSERQSLDVLWKDVFGLVPHTTVTIESENVIEDIIQLGPKEYCVEIDLMTPYNINNTPKVHIPALNHIGLWVDNLQEAVSYMTNIKKVRFTPGGIRRGASGYDVVFIHPKGSDEYPICGNGVLIELVQAPQSIIDLYTTNTTTSKNTKSTTTSLNIQQPK